MRKGGNGRGGCFDEEAWSQHANVNGAGDEECVEASQATELRLQPHVANFNAHNWQMLI